MKYSQILRDAATHIETYGLWQGGTAFPPGLDDEGIKTAPACTIGAMRVALGEENLSISSMNTLESFLRVRIDLVAPPYTSTPVWSDNATQEHVVETLRLAALDAELVEADQVPPSFVEALEKLEAASC